MGVEIERKFLVNRARWLAVVNPSIPRTHLRQAYLSLDPDRTVRVRTSDSQAWLTIKGRSQGFSRAEFEYPIPMDDAVELLNMATGLVIEKTRYSITFKGHLWVVDEFHAAHAGLLLAEVELEAQTIDPPQPDWIGEEVTQNRAYHNSVLAGAG